MSELSMSIRQPPWSFLMGVLEAFFPNEIEISRKREGEGDIERDSDKQLKSKGLTNQHFCKSATHTLLELLDLFMQVHGMTFMFTKVLSTTDTDIARETKRKRKTRKCENLRKSGVGG